MADAAGLHRALVDGLVARGVITDARVEAAFRVVPMDAPRPAVDGAIGLDKRWHRYLLDWPGRTPVVCSSGTKVVW